MMMYYFMVISLPCAFIATSLLFFALPLYFIARTCAALKTKKEKTLLLCDYTSSRVYATKFLLHGLLAGALLLGSGALLYLKEQHACALDDLIRDIPLLYESRLYILHFAKYVFSLTLACLAFIMFYTHFRQTDFEENKPNKGFLLLGLSFSLFLGTTFLQLLIRSMSSGGGCNGL